MRKIVIIPLMLLVSLVAGAQNSPKDGTWSGKLNVMGTELTVIFHLINGACTMDSPDQGVRGVPATLERGETSIKISIPTINARFEGDYRVASIVGTFTQHGKSFPMTLTPGASKRSRPQTPVAPFPYQTEEVSFSNGDALLKGTLTMPKDYNRQTPVLLMVTGSGLQNRDEEIFEHKPFAELSHINIHRGIIDQILGVGDIVLTSNHDGYNTRESHSLFRGITICDIPDYQKVYNIIKQLQTDVYSDTMYPNDLRPKENHGYNTEYRGLDL